MKRRVEVSIGMPDSIEGQDEQHPHKYANSAGKGDKPRPVKFDVYRRNFDAIFRKKKK
jgi:hypothetical protein